MNRCHWAYLAGFLDGEGSISRGNAGSLQITLTQSDPAVLSRIRESLAEVGIKANLHKGSPNGFVGRRQGYQLNIHKREHQQRFLWGVRPYVIVKKQVVEDGWRLTRMFPALRRQWCAQLAREAHP